MKAVLFVLFFSIVTFGQSDMCGQSADGEKMQVFKTSIEEVNKSIANSDRTKPLIIEINGEIEGETAILINRNNVCLRAGATHNAAIKRTKFKGRHEQPVVRIENANNVTVKGLEIVGTIEKDNCLLNPMGIYVVNSKNEAISNLHLLNNHIHTIGQVYAGACLDKSKPKNKHNLGHAHGINVRIQSSQKGNPNSKIVGVFVKGNVLNNLRLGGSEAIALNGNISGFDVSSNTISDVDNIGIDIIGGGEDVFQPAEGIVSGNHISGLLPGNGAYPFVAGIYIDGGTGLDWNRSIKVIENTVTNFGIGISVGSENDYFDLCSSCKKNPTKEKCQSFCQPDDCRSKTCQRIKTEFVLLQDNTLTWNQVYGIGIGKDSEDQNSQTWNIRVIGNTLINNVVSNDEDNFGYSQIHFGSLAKDSLKEIEIRGNTIKSIGENARLLVRVKGPANLPDVKFYENIFFSHNDKIWSWGTRFGENSYRQSELVTSCNLNLPIGVIEGENNTWNSSADEKSVCSPK